MPEESDLIAVVASLAAVGAVIYAVVRPSGGSTIVNIPEDFGEPAPDDLQEPTDDNVTVGDDETVDTGGGSEIPDSLADFDPSGRVDLIDGDVDGSDNDRPWVGL
jgi:hypothetical protein